MNNQNLSDIKIKHTELLNLYVNKNYDELSKKFLNVLTFFKDNNLFKLSEEELKIINEFIKSFLFFFIKEDYLLSFADAVEFIRLSPVISNIFDVSDYNNTDSQLKTLLSQKNNFRKVLALYSSRNTIKFDYNILFAAEPDAQLASIWYLSYFLYIILLLEALQLPYQFDLA